MTRQTDIFDNPVARARALKAKRRYDEAMELLKAELERNPDNLGAKASLADLHYRKNRHREALTLAGQILRDEPDDPRALVVMGNVLMARRKQREAIEHFRLALDVAETDYLWARVARCHLDLKKPREALEAIDRGERIQPQAPELLRLRAEAARALPDPALERETIGRAAKAAPPEPAGFYAFVLPLLSDLPRRRAADASARLRETPGQELNGHLLLFEAQAYLEGRDPHKALSRVETLLKHDPDEALRPEAESIRERAAALISDLPGSAS